jgi:hypothetical protein
MGLTIQNMAADLQTSDNTPQSAGTFDVPEATQVTLDLKIKAFATDGTSKVFFHRGALKRVGANECSLISTLQDLINDLLVAWSFDAIASGNQLQLTVTGQNGKTINWSVSGTIEFFTP